MLAAYDWNREPGPRKVANSSRAAWLSSQPGNGGVGRVCFDGGIPSSIDRTNLMKCKTTHLNKAQYGAGETLALVQCDKKLIDG